MPYDPQWPQNGQNIDADRFRGQFSGLKDFIDALNAVNAATVDGVTTVNPGDPAQVLLSLIANTLHFTFAIPQGFPGADGGPGPTGAQGPPFANAVIDAVNTLPAGSAATVSLSFDGTTVHFTFGIPEGQVGGAGGTGEPGTQGPPGEVTISDLNTAISGTSANTNAVSTLDTPFADPDAEAIRQAYNALVLGLRRP